MGMFDTVLVPCPKCGTKEEFQSKSGECFLQVVELENCPPDIFADINRHSPYSCSNCDSTFQVDLKTRKSILTSEIKEVSENNLETVQAEQEVSYSCECPNCKETIYSEFQEDWDIHEMVYYDQTIQCTDCGHSFKVSV